MSQLPSDCLNEIFKYLEEDKATLHSCLLVNRLWCEVSVEILWKNIRNYNTLIACLPNDSKEILSKNGIINLTSALRPPMFNYASFCKVLSTRQVNSNIKQLLNHNQQYISLRNLSNNLSKVTREIFKFLIAQTSLREVYLHAYSENNREFTLIPGVMGCLGNLSKLTCSSDICSEFFYQLSQTCHNIQSLNIEFVNIISNGLADLISAQQNLKALELYGYEGLTADIITSLTNLPDTLIRLKLGGKKHCRRIPLLFITKLTNLQELILSFDYYTVLKDFKELWHATFSHLQVLKFRYECPRNELLIKFLENNGKNLKEIYANDNINNSVNLAIAKFCPNLRKLFTGFRNDEIETLTTILNNCQYLESIQVWCCDDYLSEVELFEIFVKYSPENFRELKLCYSFDFESGLLPEELDTFFTSWTNRTPQKSLSLVIIHNESCRTLDEIDGNMEIIKKYIKLGIIKEFRTIENCWDDF